MSSEAANLEVIVKAIEHHNASCPWKKPATAVAMNPFEVERLGWTEIRGIPVIPDEELGTGRFKILCDGAEPAAVENEQREAVPA